VKRHRPPLMSRSTGKPVVTATTVVDGETNLAGCVQPRRGRLIRPVRRRHGPASPVGDRCLGCGRVVMTLVAPSLNDVGSQDTADFLPANALSQQAESPNRA